MDVSQRIAALTVEQFLAYIASMPPWFFIYEHYIGNMMVSFLESTIGVDCMLQIGTFPYVVAHFDGPTRLSALSLRLSQLWYVVREYGAMRRTRLSVEDLCAPEFRRLIAWL